jgi:hypothetical protein
MGSSFIISCPEAKERVNDLITFLMFFAKVSNPILKLESSSSIQASNNRETVHFFLSFQAHGYGYIQNVIQQPMTLGLV